MFLRSNFSLSTNKRFLYAHAKEVDNRQWKCLLSEWFLATNGTGDSTTQPRLIISKRGAHIPRYIEKLNIFIPSNTSENAFATGSTIEIWGHEADEE